MLLLCPFYRFFKKVQKDSRYQLAELGHEPQQSGSSCTISIAVLYHSLNITDQPSRGCGTVWLTTTESSPHMLCPARSQYEARNGTGVSQTGGRACFPEDVWFKSSNGRAEGKEVWQDQRHQRVHFPWKSWDGHWVSGWFQSMWWSCSSFSMGLGCPEDNFLRAHTRATFLNWASRPSSTIGEDSDPNHFNFSEPQKWVWL